MGAPSIPLEQLSRDELIEHIGMLMERIRVLEALVAELRAENERLMREGRRQAAPFSKGKRKATPKKPGRKPGEGRFSYRTRPAASELTEPPVEVPLARTACPACGGARRTRGRPGRRPLASFPQPDRCGPACAGWARCASAPGHRSPPASRVRSGVNAGCDSRIGCSDNHPSRAGEGRPPRAAAPALP